MINAVSVTIIVLICAIAIAFNTPSFDFTKKAAPCIAATHLPISDSTDLDDIDAAATAIHATYGSVIAHSGTSHDFYTKLAPHSIQYTSSKVAALAPILSAVKSVSARGSLIISDPFDQVYISRHASKEGDKVLYATHYDGVIRVPASSVCTIRFLTYLDGPAATFTALTSSSAFQSTAKSSVGIDFNNEQHRVDVPSSAKEARIAIKSGYHVVSPNTPYPITFLYIGAHRLVFFVAKSVLESTRAQETIVQKMTSVVLNNGFRVLSNVHMAVPVLLVTPFILSVLAAPFYIPLQFVSYMLALHHICIRSISPRYVVAGVLQFALLAHVSLLKGVQDTDGPENWKYMIASSVVWSVGTLLNVDHVFDASDSIWNSSWNSFGIRAAVFILYFGTLKISHHGCATSKLWLILLLHIVWNGVVTFFKNNELVAQKLLFAPFTEI